ncbi:MAG: hypothetical protein ACRCX2_13565 [Paraclostridium sp.]
MSKNKTVNKVEPVKISPPSEKVREISVEDSTVVSEVRPELIKEEVLVEVKSEVVENVTTVNEEPEVSPDPELDLPAEEGVGEVEDNMSIRDIDTLDRLAKYEAVKSKTLSSVADGARSRTLLIANANFKYLMECKNPELKKFNPMEVTARGTNIKASMTPEEEIYFMENNFDWFSINGTLLVNKGEMIGTSGMFMPTGNNFVVCTVKQFADIIGYEPDGSNWGIHKASYNDSSVKAWYKTKITKYNLSKFIVAYCEGKIARMDGVGRLSSAQKAELLNEAKKYEKFDTAKNK